MGVRPAANGIFRTHLRHIHPGLSSPQPETRFWLAHLPHTIPQHPHRHITPQAREHGTGLCETRLAPHLLPSVPFHRPRKSQRRMNVRSAIENFRPALSPTSRHYESLTSMDALLPIAPTEAGQRVRRLPGKRTGRQLVHPSPSDARGYSPTWQARRTASTQRSARSAWKSSRPGCVWRG